VLLSTTIQDLIHTTVAAALLLSRAQVSCCAWLLPVCLLLDPRQHLLCDQVPDAIEEVVSAVQNFQI
jgi:hypothetical protein